MSGMDRVAVIGDVGGHRAALRAELARLGMRDDLRLPDGLTVVQVGDLVHRGPESRGVVQLVDAVMRSNPGRWVQLAGNHEQLYVGDAVFEWDETLDDEAVEVLQRWWQDGSMQLAWACSTQGVEVRRSGGVRERIGVGGLLVTHAGLTRGMWQELGSLENASAVAEVINEQRFDASSRVWRPGAMLERWVNTHAGVVWAEAGNEVLESWINGEGGPGFHQAHGHSSARRWSNATWRPNTIPARCTTHADGDARIARYEVHGQVIWGCDPQHGRDAAPRWRSLELLVVE